MMKASRGSQRHSAALKASKHCLLEDTQRHSAALSVGEAIRGPRLRTSAALREALRGPQRTSAALTDTLVIPLGLARSNGREDVRIVNIPEAVPVRLVDGFESSRHRLLVGNVESSKCDERKIVDELGDGRVELRVLARKGRIALPLLEQSRTQSHSDSTEYTQSHSAHSRT